MSVKYMVPFWAPGLRIKLMAGQKGMGRELARLGPFLSESVGYRTGLYAVLREASIKLNRTIVWHNFRS